MSKNITDYLTVVDDQEKVLIQARVHKALVQEVRAYIKLKGITWNVLVWACLKRFR